MFVVGWRAWCEECRLRAGARLVCAALLLEGEDRAQDYAKEEMAHQVEIGGARQGEEIGAQDGGHDPLRADDPPDEGYDYAPDQAVNDVACAVVEEDGEGEADEDADR